MKKTFWTFLILLLLALGASGCKSSGGNGNGKQDVTVDVPDASVGEVLDSGTGEVVRDTYDSENPGNIDVPPADTSKTECTTDKDCDNNLGAETQCKTSKCVHGKCETVNLPDGTKCDDNDLCTDGDQCKGGQCVAGKNVCQCRSDKDCAQFEDGNLCNGTLKCNVDKYPHVCEVDPATVVKCDNSKDTFCMANTCDPKTGKCAMAPVHEGEACNTDSVCAKAAACKDGKCVATKTIDCDDGDVCTDDTCDPKLGCVHTWNTADCDDGNACTENDKCNKGVCSGKPRNCDDGKFCDGVESCDPQKGCVAGTPPDCDDNNACSDDYCDPDLDKCVHTPKPGMTEGPMGDPSCSDGKDNDCDKLVDDDDPGCSLSFVGLDPVSGPEDGGTLVTVSGTGLSIVTQVTFGGQSVDFKVLDDQTFQFTAPPHDPGPVDLEFGDGWTTVSVESAFTYVKLADLPNVHVDITAPDTSAPIAKGSPFPELKGTLTIDTRGDVPDNMVVQFGYGAQGTKPWTDGSWVWTNAKVTVDSNGGFDLVSNLGDAPAGVFNLAVRVSMDSGASFAYGGAGTDVLGKYDPDKAPKVVVYDYPKPGDLFFSELAWAGSSADGNDEWIELYNKASIPLLLDGLTITHASNGDKDFVFADTRHTINRHVILPHDYAVISEFDKDHSAIDVTPAVVGNNTMYLRNNITVTYQLKNSKGKIIDSAFFDGTFGGRFGTAQGEMVKTMERNKDLADGTKLSSWHTAYAHRGWDNDPLQTLNWGTPGGPNSDVAQCATDDDCSKLFADVTIDQCKMAKCLSNGTCAIVNKDDDTPCEDGLFCTDKDVCKAGKCTAGPARDCSDNIPCTIDSCDEDNDKCVHTPDPNAVEGPAGSPTCSDDVDNDCDGKKDADDPQCLLAVKSVTPDNGLVTGGTTITIEGAGFDIAKKLYLGKMDVPFTMVDSSHLTATTPVAAKVGDLDVSVSDGVVTAVLTAGFRYTGLTDAMLIGNIQGPAGPIEVVAGQPTDVIYGRVWGPDLPNDHQAVLAEVGYGPEGTRPDQNGTWQWFPTQYNEACQDCGKKFEFKGTLTISKPGTYLVAYRYSIDGGYTFLYATLGDGGDFDPSTALKVMVSGASSEDSSENADAYIDAIDAGSGTNGDVIDTGNDTGSGTNGDVIDTGNDTGSGTNSDVINASSDVNGE